MVRLPPAPHVIAISLEQSVEALHHLHQRHQLEEDLRAEGERNVEINNPIVIVPR